MTFASLKDWNISENVWVRLPFFSKEILNKYADNYKIEMLFLSWIPEGINFQTKHSRDNVSAMLKNMVDKNFQ